MESNEQNNLTNKIDTWDRLTLSEGRSVWGLGEKVERIKQSKKLSRANSMVIATGKGGLVEEDEGKGWINGDGKRLYLEQRAHEAVCR